MQRLAKNILWIWSELTVSELNQNYPEFNNTGTRFSKRSFFSCGTNRFLRRSETVSFLMVCFGSEGCATLGIILLTVIFTQTTKSLSFLFLSYNNNPLEVICHNDFTTCNGCFFWQESLSCGLNNYFTQPCVAYCFLYNRYGINILCIPRLFQIYMSL